MRRSAWILGVSVSFLASAASAQQVPGSAPNGPGAMSTQPAPAQQQPAPAGQATAPGGNAAPAAPPVGSGPVTGFTYGQGKRKSYASAPAAPRRVAAAPTGSMARPGFEMTEDGASRVFVELSAPVAVEEKRGNGSIMYVLKGARIAKWNNTNSLVTVHFNTPVSKAKLMPSGRDLHFVVELRTAGAMPTWRMENEQNAARLVIDFPKGDYLGANGEPLLQAFSGQAKPAPKAANSATPVAAPAAPAPPRAPAAPAATPGPAAPVEPARTSGGASTEFGQ